MQSEQESFIEINGGRLFLKQWFPKDISNQVPIFLFHDSLGCVQLWREFPRLLCEQLQKPVIAYDRLGFGQSSERTELPSIHFVEEEAEIYFPALLKALAIDEFDLFGHSVGGAMAIICAAKVSGCRSVITESAQAFVETRTLDGISKAKEEFKEPKNFNRLVKYHGAKASWVLRAWTDLWLSPEFAPWSLAPWLPKVQCPVLAIQGDSDEYGSVAFPEMIRNLASGKTKMQIIANCGHVPHREKTEIVLNLLQEFDHQFTGS